MGTKAGRDSRTRDQPDPAWCRCRVDGIEVDLHVQPGARRTGPAGLHGPRLKLAVQAPPTEQRANEAVLTWVARTLGVTRRAVALAAGERSRDKRVRVTGDPALLRAALERAAVTFTEGSGSAP